MIAEVVARAARVLFTPLLPDDYLAVVDPLWSARAPRGRIIATRTVGPATTELTIRTGAGWRGHRPGQHVGLGVDLGGRRHWRTYSITSAPDAEHLTVSVTAVPDGSVSVHLARVAQAGELVALGPAGGEFGAEGPLLMISGGSGITPMLGLLRGGALDGNDTVLVHSGRGGHVHADDLDALPATVHRHDSTAGHLQPSDLDTLVPDWRARTLLVCGPAGMIDAFSASADEAGVPCVVERFVSPAPTVLDDGATGGTVTFTTSGVVAEADAVTPLLRAGEDAGALLPSGCRMGICHTCVGRLSAGAVRNLHTGEIEAAEAEGDVIVRTCVSAAAGDCRIDL
ncbi:flavin reductase family protein [Actinomycetospora termitidis]|uniref:Iron-sulfur cluster-binding domain-containing protein n=1 Tax=Actinomycetospora termitidis TaxID=3053470 RepID=A0ABT7M7S4_9PSEU|nr:iron-sulfur cluster-binding domain-containing protein [Actinomycetospora sp. Odt1-22]MDL5156712.1 iron-sulfur cluster-binding domain-containing protein [Actinomycetospora sp. Odt1-22]